MPEEPEKRQPAQPQGEAQSLRGRHPSEEGDPTEAPAVPEDEEIVPNRHSASAEAAWIRWRESRDE